MTQEQKTPVRSETYKDFDIHFFFDNPSKEAKPKKTPLDKKYNLKIRNHDLLLLDKTAEYLGISRSTLINLLIERFLTKAIQAIPEKDIQAAIALVADSYANTDYQQSWQTTILEDYIPSTMGYMMEFNYYTQLPPIDNPEDYNSHAFKKIEKSLTDFLNQHAHS